VNDNDTIDTLRDQMSNLCGIFALSMMLFDRVAAGEILKLVVSALPALGPCQAVGAFLLDHTSIDVTSDMSSEGFSDIDEQLHRQLVALCGADGAVQLPDTAWAWAYPLRAVGAHSGYLVVSADAPPSTDEQFLVRTLAQQAGAALNSAALYHGERNASEELRDRNVELATVNEQLRDVVTDLERRNRMHESFTKVAATGGAAPEIATALHQLTGLGVVVEDRFGNLLGSAGGQEPKEPKPRHRSPRERTELLHRIHRNGAPMRDRDRVLALAQPRDEVLGMLALIDPQRRAGQFEFVALEDAAMVLAVELAHQRSLAETELRLRGDLVDHLLTGADEHSALARSTALGHDLRPQHQILVVAWPSAEDLERVARAVDRAMTRLTQTRALLTHRAGNVVVVAPAQDGEGRPHSWPQLHRLLAGTLPSPGGTIGVGRLCPDPSHLPRSYSEALRALRVRQSSSRTCGVTTFDELGFYRMLGNPESNRDVGEFVREWLGPLIDYDGTRNYDLVLTLWQYYECGGNYDATARELMIHRSTLRYRLRRIRELTGHDLGAVDTRLNLHIATRAWQILRGSAPGKDAGVFRGAVPGG
jgi:sugar diacid utilization regulator